MSDETGPPEGTDIEEPEDFVTPEEAWLDPGPLLGHQGLDDIDVGDPDNPELPHPEGDMSPRLTVSPKGGY